MAQPDGFILDPKTEKFLASIKPAATDTHRRGTQTLQLKTGLRLHRRGDFEGADACFRCAHDQAVAIQDKVEVERCVFARARSQAHLAPRTSLALLQQLRRDRSSVLRPIPTNFLIGTLLHEFSQPELASENNARLVALCDETRSEPWGAFAREHLALNRFDLGDVAGSQRLHNQALKQLSDGQEVDKLGLVFVNMAVHANIEARFDESLDFLNRSREFLKEKPNFYLGFMIHLTEGVLALCTDEFDTAADRFRTAEKLAASIALPSQMGIAFLWKSLLLGNADQTDILATFDSIARDVLQRGLVLESGMCLLQAGCWARSRGLSGESYLERGHALLGGGPGADLRIAHYTRLMEAISRPKRSRRSRQPFPEFLTRAPEILKLKNQLKRLVDTDVRVLLEGESGTGKTFLAKQIHASGKRRKSPFVTVDCTNLEENLFESKLFGHQRGAFTGAVSDHVGLVEQANKGTLFLDEIGEVPIEIQAKLLYTIEEQRYRPVGGKVEKQAEFRVIAATNRCIDEMLDCGALRKDLFFRLAGYRVDIPPLRERPEDIEPLVELRLSELNERYNRRKVIQPAAWSAIAEYAWPGNVRELNATLERGFHLAHGRRVGVDDLGLGISASSLDTLDLSWYTVRRTHLLRVLRLCRGNVSQAAKLLGLNRTTLIYKLKLLDIERRHFDPRLEESEAEAPSLHLVADGDDPAATA